MRISGQNLRTTAESHRNWIRIAGMLSHSGVWGAMAQSVFIRYVRSDSSGNMYATWRVIRQHQTTMRGAVIFFLTNFGRVRILRLYRWPKSGTIAKVAINLHQV